MQNRTGEEMPKLRIFEFPQKQKGESHFYYNSNPHKNLKKEIYNSWIKKHYQITDG